jgi:hypothetical protein
VAKVLTYQVQGSEFKPQYRKKNEKKKQQQKP